MDMKEKITNAVSKVPLKKIGATLVIGTLIAGTGAWYHHQQKEIQHAKKAEARLALIQHQAEQQNVVILDTNKIRTIAAEAIGVEENTISFHKIDLKNVACLDTKSMFNPIYKVSCVTNDVKYKLKIDAVTGKVLEANI